MLKNKLSMIKSNKLAILAIIATIMTSGLPMTVISAETPDAVYVGDFTAGATLNNMDYSDVKNSNTSAKPAIYEASALGITKGFANMAKRFGRTDTLSKEEALAVVYRAVGREAEAQILGENLNNARAAADKKKDVLQVWYDGFLQLAANDGLITQQQLTDALNMDQASLDTTAFKRKAAAQRQEMAYWLAKALKLEAVRGQQDILNNYMDWRSADPDKVPFIEAVLQNKIMNGDGYGHFNPTKAITREQAAQIVKNAEPQILTALKFEKMTGTIDKISTTGDYSKGGSTGGKNIDVRNSLGTLHRITTESSAAGANEQQSAQTTQNRRELVVYKNGSVGNSSLLTKGDRIEYIVRTSDKTVKFINVLSNVNKERYVAAQINSIDANNLLMNVMQFFKLDFPNMELLKQNVSFNLKNEAQQITYRYSKNTFVTLNGVKSSIENLNPDSTVILTINNNNVITAIQTADFSINSEENLVVKGIVEDNNPQLGYITLYNEDGTGTGKPAEEQLAALRTFNYVNQNALEVYRNHSTAGVDSIQTGDTAFLKLDEDGNVVSISAVDNYTTKYGKIISKQAGKIVVEYENGSQQVLQVPDDVLFIKDKKLTSLSALQDGDRVKLLLNITNKSTGLKEVTIEGNEHFITNIYKGDISNIDITSEKLIVFKLQSFQKGKWERTDRKGSTNIPLSSESRIYLGNKLIDIDKVNELLRGNEAYIAVEKDYGGEEKAVLVSFRNSEDAEALYNEAIAGTITGNSSFTITGIDKNIGYDAGSIVVKNGRLVSGGSLAADDLAYAAVNRNYDTGDYKAGVVMVEEPGSAQATQLYRARIKSVDENNSFTVQSFSELVGNNWEYHNTPKTFRLTYNTSLLGDDGIDNIRDFTGFGTGSYVDRTVYVLAEDTDALIISTAPYGMVNMKGTVYEISGGETGEEGTLLTEPDTIKLRSVKLYNPTSYVWENIKELELGILKNSIILKNGSAIKPSDIRTGDSIRVIKKDGSLTGDAYIIMVE